MDEKECLNREYELLSQELGKAMKHVKDDQDVQRIREIVSRMEELHPEDESEYKGTEYYWERFKDRHLQDALEIAELIHNQEREVKLKERGGKKALTRSTRFAAVFIIILIAVNTTTIVFAGYNIFKPIISWTENIFSKKGRTSTEYSEDNKKDINNCLSLDEVEDCLEIQLFKPDAVKLGYSQTEFSVNDLSGMVYIGINYDYDGVNIQYGISVYLTPLNYTQIIEKTDEEVEIYTEDDMEVYIIKNENWYILSWQDVYVDYVVTGFEDKASVEEFIKSLRK